MTPTLSESNKESFLGQEESLRREHTERMIAFIDNVYDSIEHKDPKSDGDLLIKMICDGLEDAENGLREDINPVREIQRLWDQNGDQDNLVWFTGLGLLIEISREDKDPEGIEKYKQGPRYVTNLDDIFCGEPKIVTTQDDELSITTLLAFPFLAEDILPNVHITNETRRAILYEVFQEIKHRNESKE